MTLIPLGASDAHLVPTWLGCGQQTTDYNPEPGGVLISREVVGLNGSQGFPSCHSSDKGGTLFSETALIVGVDVHGRRNVTLVMDGGGDVVDKHRTFANNRLGSDPFASYLAEMAQRGSFPTIPIAAEATNNYWLPFFCHLAETPALAAWPVTLYPFNPRLVANFKKALGEEEKTDLRDAGVVTERVRFGKKLPRPFAMDALYLPLRTLTRYRSHLGREWVRVKSHSLSLIYLKATDYTDKVKKPFSNPFGVTSQAVLRQFATLDESANTPLDELAAWLDVKGKRRFPNPEENARQRQQGAEAAYQLPDEWTAVIHDVISLNLHHIACLKNLIDRVETAMDPANGEHSPSPGDAPRHRPCLRRRHRRRNR